MILVDRGSWWDVCELIFVSPAGYVDFALSLSAGVSFQSGLLWGSMLFALVEILVEGSMVIYFLVVDGWFLFVIVLIFFGMFLG